MSRWQQLLHGDPANVEALLNLATVNWQLHHYSQAMDALETVLSLDPDNREALYRSGLLLYERQMYEEAVPALSRLNQLEPTGYRDSRRLLHNVQRTTANITTLKHN